jgi:predicted solute-binding protein
MSESLPRIGCVPYLNARPLLEGLQASVTELVPALLHGEFSKGLFDAALLSSIDVLATPNAEVVDGVSIASRGEVYSVVLAYQGELESLTKIQLDPASHTSNALLQIVLTEFYGLNPEYVHITEGGVFSFPALLIGDAAISSRKRTSCHELKFLDLGEVWYRHTGLPFVFALWILRKDFTKKKMLSILLRAAKTQGMGNRHEIAARMPDPDFALRYMTNWISYDLGEQEKRGLDLFKTYLSQKDMISLHRDKINYI